MTKTMQKAMASLATLPEADQEKIGQQLLDHVEKLKALRVDIAKAINSLDAGRGRPLDIEDFLRRARDEHGRS